jgi:TRAP-type mannitol/chloroaromatic compound transport system permease small subunit
MATAVMYLSWPIFLLALHNNEQSSNAGGLALWPVRLLVPIGFFLLVIQGISELIKRIGFLQGRCPDPTEKAHKPTPEEELALAIKAQKGEL